MEKQNGNDGEEELVFQQQGNKGLSNDTISAGGIDGGFSAEELKDLLR
jgi:hypothetical protein